MTQIVKGERREEERKVALKKIENFREKKKYTRQILTEKNNYFPEKCFKKIENRPRTEIGLTAQVLKGYK